MPDLFSDEGLAELRSLAADRTLLAFDLDGTLAPIVNDPAHARVAVGTAARLRSLQAHWPIAVLTGRELTDAAPRLGFRPHFLFGNHGAQRPGQPNTGSMNTALDAWRRLLRANKAALHEQGIDVEDKGLSLALHFRKAKDHCAVRVWLDSLAATLEPTVRATHGHCVLNITPANAADKGDALLNAMHACGARTCVVVGDDTNDEPAFAKAPRTSVTVRIGPESMPTCARFSLRSQESVDSLLETLEQLRA